MWQSDGLPGPPATKGTLMRRALTVLAGTAVLAVTLGSPVSGEEPVDTVVATAQSTAATVQDKVQNVHVPGGAGAIGGGASGRSAVVGAIVVTSTAATTGAQPEHRMIGALADPTQWTCTGGGTTALYRVTCVPRQLPVPVAYHCDVLHADALVPLAGSSARTSMDCDSDGQPEARTALVTGPNGWDTDLAVDTRAVTAFTCVVDSGAGDYTARCGDPGYVGVE